MEKMRENKIWIYRVKDSKNIQLPESVGPSYSYQFEYLGGSNTSGSCRPDVRIISNVVESTVKDGEAL